MLSFRPAKDLPLERGHICIFRQIIPPHYIPALSFPLCYFPGSLFRKQFASLCILFQPCIPFAALYEHITDFLIQ